MRPRDVSARSACVARAMRRGLEAEVERTVATGLAWRKERSRGARLAVGAGLADGEVAGGLLPRRAGRARSRCGAQRYDLTNHEGSAPVCGHDRR